MDRDIYTVLREDIIWLRLRPGLFFSIKDICAKYDSSRTPTRDALIRLEQEGLITFLPQRGTMVSRLDMGRVEDEHFIRRAIEKHVMQEFVGRYSSSVISHLNEGIRRQRECIAANDIRGFFAADDDFHYLFYKETGREFCWEIIQKECGNYKRFRLLTLLLEEDDHETPAQKDSTKEIIHEGLPNAGKTMSIREDAGTSGMYEIVGGHERLLVSVRNRDLDASLRILDEHIGRIWVQERQLRKGLPDLFGEGTMRDRRNNSDADTDFLLSLRGYFTP